MFAGLDFGTSNCAMAICNDDRPQLLPMEGASPFIPSALYALDRTLISDAISANIHDAGLRRHYQQNREKELLLGANTRRNLQLGDTEPYWFMGSEAITQYINNPGEGWFVKSPKSYLGTIGLRKEQLALFEDLVALMVLRVKNHGEQQTDASYSQVVIGRPINFLGIGGEESNRQAQQILYNAAQTAGFKDIEFFYEPLAAGIEFENTLTEDKTVLVMDIGGGTSDCSLIRMGPSLRHKIDRSDDFLGHAGIRVGGNDLDISLDYQELMLELGRNSLLKNGLFVPAHYYACAAKINDVNAQGTFQSREYRQGLVQLIADAQEPEKIRRLQKLQQYRLNFQLTHSAENCKIALSAEPSCTVDLSYIEAQLKTEITASKFEQAIEKSLHSITSIIDIVVEQGGSKPDIVFLTGGSCKSPIVRQAIQQKLGDVVTTDGDYFGSVVSGLATWANNVFRPSAKKGR